MRHEYPIPISDPPRPRRPPAVIILVPYNLRARMLSSWHSSTIREESKTKKTVYNHQRDTTFLEQKCTTAMPSNARLHL